MRANIGNQTDTAIEQYGFWRQPLFHMSQSMFAIAVLAALIDGDFYLSDEGQYVLSALTGCSAAYYLAVSHFLFPDDLKSSEKELANIKVFPYLAVGLLSCFYYAMLRAFEVDVVYYNSLWVVYAVTLYLVAEGCNRLNYNVIVEAFSRASLALSGIVLLSVLINPVRLWDSPSYVYLHSTIFTHTILSLFYFFLTFRRNLLDYIRKDVFMSLGTVAVTATYVLMLIRARLEIQWLGMMLAIFSGVLIVATYYLKRNQDKLPEGKLHLPPAIMAMALTVIAPISTLEKPTAAILTFLVISAVYTFLCFVYDKRVFIYLSSAAFTGAYFFIGKEMNISGYHYAFWFLALCPAKILLGRGLNNHKEGTFTKPLYITGVSITLLVLTTLIFQGRGFWLNNVDMAIVFTIALAATYAFAGFVIAKKLFYYASAMMLLGAYYLLLAKFNPGWVEWYTIPPALIILTLSSSMRERLDNFNYLVELLGVSVLFLPSFISSFGKNSLSHAVILAFLAIGVGMYGSTRQSKVCFFGGTVALIADILVQTVPRLHLGSVPKTIWFMLIAALLIATGIIAERAVNNEAFRNKLIAVRNWAVEKFRDWN